MSWSLECGENEASFRSTHVSVEPVIDVDPDVAQGNRDHIRYWNSLSDREFDIESHEAIVASGLHNFRSCRIPVRSN